MVRELAANPERYERNENENIRRNGERAANTRPISRSMIKRAGLPKSCASGTISLNSNALNCNCRFFESSLIMPVKVWPWVISGVESST